MPAKPLALSRGVRERMTTHAIQVVLYARVSSKDQEKEGFSIPAQLRLLRDHAAAKGFAIAAEFTDVETAKVSGRTEFGKMLAYLRKHTGVCRTILVEKTDRLYRNIKDYAIVDELDVEVHLVKENEIISRLSRSSEQFAHGIKVLMARNYSLNLGEETTKGMTEKARAGIYPSYAPIGYRNVDGPNGKRIIVPDPEAASVITDLFTRFARGNYSLKTLVREFNAEGLTLRGRRLHSSFAHQILRKRLYCGDFDWDGKTYRGSHEALITLERWQRVQDVLDARAENKTRKVKHDFAFSGLIRCGHCGCMLVGELKKHRYVYYHCTGNRGKCPEPYTRQEYLTGEFANILQELVIPQPVLDWLQESVLQSDRTEHASREQAIKRLQSQHGQIESRIEQMYIDKLNGQITEEFFVRMAAAKREEQQALLRKILTIQTAAPTPLDEAVDMLRLTSRASELFVQQPAAEQRRLVGILLESAAWQDGELRTTLFEPFELLRRSNRESYTKQKENNGSGCDLEVWLLR
jgi:site-specific DNA recombinase